MLNLFGQNYNQQTLHFPFILKLRLVVSINTLFFWYKQLQVATYAIEIAIHLINKNRVLIKKRR